MSKELEELAAHCAAMQEHYKTAVGQWVTMSSPGTIDMIAKLVGVIAEQQKQIDELRDLQLADLL